MVAEVLLGIGLAGLAPSLCARTRVLARGSLRCEPLILYRFPVFEY
jgi:hypothetical protein